MWLRAVSATTGFFMERWFRMYGDLAASLIMFFFAPSSFAADSLATLMYRRFGEDKFPSTSIRMEQFRAHLEYLKEK
jgi:hypothetical protein